MQPMRTSPTKIEMIFIARLTRDEQAQDGPEDARDKEMPDGDSQEEGNTAPIEPQPARAQDRRLARPGQQQREPGVRGIAVSGCDDKAERMKRKLQQPAAQQGQQKDKAEPAACGERAGKA